MKFTKKCVCCNRKASSKYRGRPFCNDCLKEVKRSGANVVWAEKLVFSLGDFAIYRDVPVKLK